MDILLSAKVILRAMVTERSGSSEGMCMCVWKSLDNHPWTSIFWMSCQLEVLKIVCTGKACQYKMWYFMNRVRYNWRTSLALKEEIPIMSLSPAFHQLFTSFSPDFPPSVANFTYAQDKPLIEPFGLGFPSHLDYCHISTHGGQNVLRNIFSTAS